MSTSLPEPLHRTPVTLAGPLRQPRQLLGDQTYGGHDSIHDDATAAQLGFRSGPIEGPTHFSQLVPLLASLWGAEWFSTGCVSAHYRNVVVEGEEVRAFVDVPVHGARSVGIRAEKADGTPVLSGTACVGEPAEPTECELRMAAARPPEHPVVLDQLSVGQRGARVEEVRMGFDDHLGALYPFTLSEKLAVITEPMAWYQPEGAATSPWGRPVIPVEMVSVLTSYTSGQAGFAVRQPSVGLFLDQEVRLVDGALLVDEPYVLEREIVALGESRRTESYWTRTSVRRPGDGGVAAVVLLHQGVLKESYVG